MICSQLNQICLMITTLIVCGFHNQNIVEAKPSPQLTLIVNPDSNGIDDYPNYPKKPRNPGGGFDILQISNGPNPDCQNDVSNNRPSKLIVLKSWNQDQNLVNLNGVIYRRLQVNDGFTNDIQEPCSPRVCRGKCRSRGEVGLCYQRVCACADVAPKQKLVMNVINNNNRNDRQDDSSIEQILQEMYDIDLDQNQQPSESEPAPEPAPPPQPSQDQILDQILYQNDQDFGLANQNPSSYSNDKSNRIYIFVPKK